MRAQLVEKEKMVAIGQIAAGIGHEVCNPLSSISSIVQMLKRARSATLKTEELNLIEVNIERISSTVRQLVSLSRPNTEEWTRVELGAILDEVVQLITFDQRARGVEIKFEPSPGLSETYALRDQLTQVFINLSLNALDAMPDGGTLRIEIGEGQGNLVTRVQDTGCGVDPEIGRRVFEPFFTTKEPGRGTGLGLAVSYSIVEKHGGSMEFASTPGEGSVFSVTIPVLPEAPDVDHD
jgi:signal transduction histidine kinase